MNRDYRAITWVEANHLTNSLIARGLVVGAVLGVGVLIAWSMVNDLLEEVAAGLT